MNPRTKTLQLFHAVAIQRLVVLTLLWLISSVAVLGGAVGGTSVNQAVSGLLTPDATIAVNLTGIRIAAPALNQSFSYDIVPSNSGTVPLDTMTVIDALPVQMQVSNVSTGSYTNLSDFAAGVGERVSYEKNTAPGVFTLWGSSPNATTNTTLTAPPPGLGAGEYITKIRWEYGQAAAGMAANIPPRITGQITNPDHAGSVVAVGNTIANSISLNAVYTAGPTNVSRNASTSFTVSPAVGTVTLPATSTGTAGTGATFSFNAAGLTPASGNLTVTAPANVEVSANGTTWVSNYTVAYTGGALGVTTVNARLAGTGTTGPISGNVAVSGGGSATANQAVSGTLNANPLVTATLTGTTTRVDHSVVVGGTINYTAKISNVDPSVTKTAVAFNLPLDSNTTLSGGPNASPYTFDQPSVTATLGTAKALTLVAVDPDAADTLTYAITQSPVNGSLSGFNASTGAVSYTGTTLGSDTIKFKATDNHGVSSNEDGVITLNVISAPLNNFLVEAVGGGTISSQTAGAPFNIRITARDASNNTKSDFTGTATLTSSSVFGAGGGVTGNFVNGVLASTSVTLNTAGAAQTITATSGAISTASAAFVINGGALNNFLVEAGAGGSILTQTAGGAFNIKVTARDSFNNVANLFTGTTDLTTTSTFSAGGGTTPAFTAGLLANYSVTLTLSGTSQTITATNSAGAQSGVSNPFTLNPGALNDFLVEGTAGGPIPTPQLAGASFNIKLTARDAFQNIKTDFVSTAALSSTPGGVFPTTSNAFAAGVVASHSVSFAAGNNYTITCTSGGKSGTSSSFAVNQPPTAVAEAPIATSVPGNAWHVALNVMNDTVGNLSVLTNDNRGFPLANVVSFGKTTGSEVSVASGLTTPTTGGGSIKVLGDGSLSYTPLTDFTGLDTFKYTLSNGINPDSVGTVTIAVGVRPAVANDTYAPALIGNVGINTIISGFSALTNDTGDRKVAALVSATNGNATMAADGTFTFNPNPGYSGTGTITYSLSNGFGAAASNGTVSMTVGSSRVWFVDNNNGTNGDGRLGSPFNSLGSVSGVDAAGDTVFLYRNTATSYGGSITLKNNEKLFGQGATAATFTALTGLTFPADSTGLPTLSGTNPAIAGGMTLGSGNTLRGVTSNGSITGSSFGTLTVSETAINTSSQALSLTTGTVAGAGFTSVTSTGGTNNVALVGVGGTLTMSGGALSGASGAAFTVGTSGGTINYGGTINNSNNGISLTSNSGTINFTGALTLSTGANTAFSATGGGTVTASEGVSTTSTLSTTTGTALNVVNTTIGASGLKFKSISAGTAAGGPANGIVLNATGASGGLTVTGVGTTAGSGGTVQKCTLSGAAFTSCSGISLKNMNFVGNATTPGSGIDDISAGSDVANNANIYMVSVTTATLDHLFIDGTGSNDTGILGNGVNGLTINVVEVLNFKNNIAKTPFLQQNLSGTCQFTNLSVHDNNSIHTVFITQNTGTATITFTSPNIQNGGGANNPDGIQVDAYNTANVTVSATNVTVNNTPGNGVMFQASSGSTMNATLDGGTVTLVNGILMASSGTGTQFTYAVKNLTSVTTHNLGSSAITVGKGSGGAGSVTTGTVSNNVITSALAGGGASGIAVKAFGAGGVANATVTGNDISGVDGSAIIVSGGQGSTSHNLTIQGNNIHNPALTQPGNIPNSSYAIDLVAGTQSGDAPAWSVILGDMSFGHNVPANKNLITGSWASGGHPIEAVIFNNSTFKLFNYPNSNTNDANAAAWISASNGGLGVDATHLGTNQFTGGPTFPLLNAAGGVESTMPLAKAQPLTQPQLDNLVSAARARWETSGLSATQRAILATLKIEVAKLSGGRLGEAAPGVIRIDANAGGLGWYVGEFRVPSSEYRVEGSGAFADVVSSTRAYTTPTRAPAGRIDLLTTLMHEMGHALGLADRYDAGARNSIMYGFLTKGERRLPAKDEAGGVENGNRRLENVPLLKEPEAERETTSKEQGTVPWHPVLFALLGLLGALGFRRFRFAAVALLLAGCVALGSARAATVGESIGNLPPGKSTTITFSATVKNPTSPVLAPSVSQQATVSGSNFASVLSDDPGVGGTADATVTTVLHGPDLTLTASHSGNFTQNDTGKTYTLTVTNSGGQATDGSAVIVMATPPTGLSFTGVVASGWTINTTSPLSVQRSDPLNASLSYPVITLTVSVANSAPTSINFTAAVSGGGELDTTNDSASDPTTVVQVPASITVVSGSGQSVVVNTGFASPLQAVVKDAGGAVISGASVTFTAPASGPSVVFAGGFPTLTAATNSSGIAGPAFTANTIAGSYTVTAAVGGVVTPASFLLTNNPGVPTQLAYLQQPTSSVAGNTIAPPITVQILDQFNNLTQTSTDNVTLGFGTNPSGGTLTGPSTVTASSGTATFTPLSINKAGIGYRLTASDGALTGTTSNTFNIAPAAANHFVVSAPGSATAGTSFGITVTALDSFNNIATGYTGTATFTKTDSGAGSAVPSNYTFVPGDSGSHTFTSLTTLVTAGLQTVTVKDSVIATISGTSGNVAVIAGAANHFSVSAPPSATAGAPFSITVTALDAFNNTAMSYGGTVTFTKTDNGAAAAVPSNYTFVAGDNGVHGFTNGTTFVTAGNQTVTAKDTVTSTITGTSANVAVSAAAATHFTMIAPPAATAGVPFSVTVTALDSFGNTAAAYTGTVHFTKTDAGTGSALPADYAFVSGDNGVHVFTNGVTFVTAATQTVTVKDTLNAVLPVTSGGVLVNPGAATHYTVSAPGSTTAGVPFGITVTALDQFNNSAAGGYSGTAHFTTSDSGAGSVLPADYKFVIADNGVHTFTNGVTFVTAGNQTVSATDTVTPAVTGISSNVTVNAGAPTHLLVTAPSNATVGVSFNSTVTVQDAFNNTAIAYAGTVHFSTSDLAASLSPDTTLTSGTGTFAATLNTSGGQTLTATDTVSAGVTGTSGNIAVSKADSVTTVTSSINPSVFGTPVTFTATVTHSLGSATLTGSVIFSIDGTPVSGSVTLTGNTASYTTAVDQLNVAGSGHAISAAFSGDANYLAGSGILTAGGQFIHEKNSTSTITSVAPSPSTFGQAVTLTATVTPTIGATLPTGTVIFMDGAAALGAPATLSNVASVATATFTTGVTQLTGGGHSFTAVYSSDANFSASTSTPATSLTVATAATNTTIVSVTPASPAPQGQALTFKVTVGTALNGVLPTGTLTFSEGAVTLGTSSALAGVSGVATATFTSAANAFTNGAHTVKASFAGDINYTSSSGTIAIIVNSPPTIAGTAGNQQVNDNATLKPFAAVVIADVDRPAQTQTVVFTLSDSAKGTITTANGFSAAGSVFTFFGTASAATSALNGVVFTPIPNRLPPMQTEMENFTLTTNDGIAPTVSDSVTSVVITSINDAPSNVQTQVSLASINENDSITLSGTFVDPDVQDAHTVSVDWGDGTPATVLPLAVNVFQFSAAHKYLNNPTGAPTGSFTVTSTVTDGLGAKSTGSSTVQVKNAAPAVVIGGLPQGTAPGTAITLTSTVTDPGTLDTFSYAWTVTKNGAPFAAGAASSLSFTPDTDGTYVVTLVVSDNDGGTGSANATIQVDTGADALGSVTGVVDPLNGLEYVFNANVNTTRPYTLSWDFGDGTAPQSGNPITHDYPALGTYIVSLTVTLNLPSGPEILTKQLTVTINGSALKAPIVFEVVSGKLAFDLKGQKDRLQLTGYIPLPLNYKPAGKVFTVSIGSLSRTFTLDSDAKGGDANNRISLNNGLKSGQFVTISAKLTLLLQKQDLYDSLKTLGFQDATGSTPINITLPMTLTYEGQTAVELIKLKFKATSNGGSGVIVRR